MKKNVRIRDGFIINYNMIYINIFYLCILYKYIWTVLTLLTDWLTYRRTVKTILYRFVWNVGKMYLLLSTVLRKDFSKIQPLKRCNGGSKFIICMSFFLFVHTPKLLKYRFQKRHINISSGPAECHRLKIILILYCYFIGNNSYKKKFYLLRYLMTSSGWIAKLYRPNVFLVIAFINLLFILDLYV